jgi:hypothetical protein
MVPADSHKASPTSRYSGYHYHVKTYVYGTVTLYGLTFQKVQLHFYNHVVVLQPHACRNMYGLGSFPFARHYSGNHCYFLFLRLLRCFSSAGSLYIVSLRTGCPIRKSTDQSLSAAPHSLSQLVTSFIASETQGIPHTPLVT